MSIRSTLASVVAHRQSTESTTVDSPREPLELRLAPYAVTATTISIPHQRQGGSTAGADCPSSG